MHKSPFKFGLFLMASLMLLASTVATIPMGSLNIFSNATAQGYNENYYEDKKYSKYPTNDYKYECQKGPFKGFYVSSVEFCDAKAPIDKEDKKPIVLVKKELFMCNNVVTTGVFFDCFTQFENAAGPKSGEYTSCNEVLCPGIDESEFAVQIFKDVATVPDLTPQGTLVNLDKFHYSVTENRISDLITDESTLCFPTGFRHFLFYEKETEDNFVQYNICVKYVGDCDGTIYPGEVKTCTIENYIVAGVIRELQTGNAINSAPTGTTTQSNNAIPTTTTTTQSSNVVGVPQSSNVGATAALQSSSVGTPNTPPSSTPSSPLLNLFP